MSSEQQGTSSRKEDPPCIVSGRVAPSKSEGDSFTSPAADISALAPMFGGLAIASAVPPQAGLSSAGPVTYPRGQTFNPYYSGYNPPGLSYPAHPYAAQHYPVQQYPGQEYGGHHSPGVYHPQQQYLGSQGHGQRGYGEYAPGQQTMLQAPTEPRHQRQTSWRYSAAARSHTANAEAGPSNYQTAPPQRPPVPVSVPTSTDGPSNTTPAGDLLPPQRKPFTPMDVVASSSSQQHANRTVSPLEKILHGFSPNYLGDIHDPRNRSADIPLSQSTSLYLRKLPPGTTAKMVLDALCPHAPFGKVHSVHITPADDKYPTAAARLVMFTRAGAEKVYDLVNNGGLIMQGRPVSVMWNKHRVAETKLDAEFICRVLCIKGPKEVVDFRPIKDHLDGLISYTMQEVCVVDEFEKPGQRLVVLVFGSWHVQTMVARMAIKSHWPGVEVTFGKDPMEVGVQKAYVENLGGSQGVSVSVGGNA